MPATSYHPLLGPVVAFGALLVIILICRWVFSTSDRDARTARALAGRDGDYGLLVPVAAAPTAEDAEMLCGVLRAAGIRATRAGTEVLVFRADALRARELVRS